MSMPLKVVKIQESGRTYRIERSGPWYTIEHVKPDGQRVFIARIKGSFDAARETCRWHVRKSLGIK